MVIDDFATLSMAPCRLKPFWTMKTDTTTNHRANTHADDPHTTNNGVAAVNSHLG